MKILLQRLEQLAEHRRVACPVVTPGEVEELAVFVREHLRKTNFERELVFTLVESVMTVGAACPVVRPLGTLRSLMAAKLAAENAFACSLPAKRHALPGAPDQRIHWLDGLEQSSGQVMLPGVMFGYAIWQTILR